MDTGSDQKLLVAPDMDFYIGGEAYNMRYDENYVLGYPIQPYY